MKNYRDLTIALSATQRFATARRKVMADWPDTFPCQTMGTQPRCLDCPFFGLYVSRLQDELQGMLDSVDPSDLSFLSWTAPLRQAPYSDEVPGWGCTLFAAGLTLSEVQFFLGVKSRSKVRSWLRKGGLLMSAEACTEEQQATCVSLFRQGQCLTDIEDATRVDADVIRKWLTPAERKIAQTRLYSLQTQQMALELFKAGADNHTLYEEMGIDPTTIVRWAKEAGIKRPIVVQQGRRGIDYHQKRQQARQLKQKGYGTAKIGELLEVSQDTVGRWLNERLKPE